MRKRLFIVLLSMLLLLSSLALAENAAPGREVTLSIHFIGNLIFSRYSVVVRLDDTEIATLSHGQDYEETLTLTEGDHVLTFLQKDREENWNSIPLLPDENGYFPCTLETRRNAIHLRNDLTGEMSPVEDAVRQQYISECETISFKDVERYPDQNQGRKIRLEGQVTQASEGLLHTMTLKVRDDSGSIWNVEYHRGSGEPRFLTKDKVVVYGECRGVQLSLSLLKEPAAIPTVRAVYIDLE